MAGITQQVLDKLDNVSNMVARIEERQINQSEDITELMKVTIKGNGHLPLTQRVQKLEDCQSDQKNELKSKKEKWDLRSWAILLLIIGQIITFTGKWLFGG